MDMLLLLTEKEFSAFVFGRFANAGNPVLEDDK